jgi:hypothetical protein
MHPLTRRRVCSPLLWFRGGGYTLAAGEGVGGVPIQTRGQTLWYSRYLPVVYMQSSLEDEAA